MVDQIVKASRVPVRDQFGSLDRQADRLVPANRRCTSDVPGGKWIAQLVERGLLRATGRSEAAQLIEVDGLVTDRRGFGVVVPVACQISRRTVVAGSLFQ